MMLNKRYRWLLLPTVVLALHVLRLQLTQIRTPKGTERRFRRDNASAFQTTLSSSPELFIHVPSWLEGMSSWMISLSEIVVLAKELNATLIEPCISGGKLTSCCSESTFDGNNTTAIQLGQVLNLALLKTYYSRIISYEDYIEATAALGDTLSVPVVRLCMHWIVKWPRQRNCGDEPTYFNVSTIPQIDKALYSAQHSTTVLEIAKYRHHAFRASDWVNEVEAAMVKREYIQFAPDTFRRANELLASMGVQSGQPYSVIHWRAELPNIDYLACADRIVRTRNAMQQQQTQQEQHQHQQRGQQQQQQQQHPFVLMSSLNTNSNYMWHGAKRLAANSTSDQALQMLFDHGFLKLDQVIDYDQLADPGLIAVYDLILALNAQQFATCTRQCRNRGYCGICNWQGQFAGLAVSIRNDMAQKSSLECWPH